MSVKFWDELNKSNLTGSHTLLSGNSASKAAEYTTVQDILNFGMVQTTGTATDKYMSQNAVSNHILSTDYHLIPIDSSRLDSSVIPGFYKVVYPSTTRPYQSWSVMRVTASVQTLGPMNYRYIISQVLLYPDGLTYEHRTGTTIDFNTPATDWTEWEDITPAKQTYVDGTFIKNGENDKIDFSSKDSFFLKVAKDVEIKSKYFSFEALQGYVKVTGYLSAEGENVALAAEKNIYLTSKSIKLFTQGGGTLTLNDTEIPTINQVVVNGNNYRAVSINCLHSNGGAFPFSIDATAIVFRTMGEGEVRWNDQRMVVEGDLEAYQKLLKDGVNIITINGETILQAKNIELATKQQHDQLSSTVSEHTSSISKLQADVKTAQQTADQGLTTAKRAVQDAASAQGTADIAEKKAENAQDTADTAQSTANKGVRDAATAQATADTADRKADKAQETADDAHERIEGLATVNGHSLLDGGNISISVSRSNYLYGKERVKVDASGVVELPEDMESLVNVYYNRVIMYDHEYEVDEETNTLTIIAPDIVKIIEPEKDYCFITYLKKNTGVPRTESKTLLIDEAGQIDLPRTVDEVLEVFWERTLLYEGEYVFNRNSNKIIIVDESVDFDYNTDVFKVTYTY